MAQAKVLNEKEIRKVLLYIASKKHSARNRCMFLMTTNCGMRVGEVAALHICDVLTSDGQIVDEIRLKAEQTKGSVGRTVLLSKKMQEELHQRDQKKEAHDDQRNTALHRQHLRVLFVPTSMALRLGHSQP